MTVEITMRQDGAKYLQKNEHFKFIKTKKKMIWSDFSERVTFKMEVSRKWTLQPPSPANYYYYFIFLLASWSSQVGVLCKVSTFTLQFQPQTDINWE